MKLRISRVAKLLCTVFLGIAVVSGISLTLSSNPASAAGSSIATQELGNSASLNFDLSTGTITSGTLTKAADIIIPGEINGVKVAHIADSAFNDELLLSVALPDSIVSIGDNAFSGCSIAYITIPGSVTSIGSNAFADCSILQDARFYGDAPSIGSDVFKASAPGFTIIYAAGSKGFTNPWSGFPSEAFDSAIQIQTTGNALDNVNASNSKQVPVTELGTLGGKSSGANFINNHDQVVGWADTANKETHAFLWENGKMEDLGTLGGAYSTAYSINNRGQVTGISTLEDKTMHAFMWEDGKMTDLGTLGGTMTYAYSINDNGQIVGLSSLENGKTHAFLWENGKMTDLGTLGGEYSSASSINNKGEIVGQSSNSNGSEHAVLWQAGKITDLNPPENNDQSGAYCINDNGQVIGEIGTVSTNLIDSFLWQDGKMNIDFFACHPSFINDKGQVMGNYSMSASFESAFYGDTSHLLYISMWQNNKTVSYNVHSDELAYAFSINDHGQAVGGYKIGKACMWSIDPQPEAETSAKPAAATATSPATAAPETLAVTQAVASPEVQAQQHASSGGIWIILICILAALVLIVILVMRKKWGKNR